MADQKISQQTEHTTLVFGTDLLPMVANTNTTPTNYKVQVKNFLSQFSIDLPQTNISAFRLVANITANANTSLQVAGEFDIVANSSVGVQSLTRYGLLAQNLIQNGNTQILGQMAAGVFVLDIANSNVVGSNTYGVLIENLTNSSVTAARVIQPQAYIGIAENAGSNTAAKTKYLMELGIVGNTVSSDTANTNTTVIFSKTTDQVATHMVKLRINGMDVWLLASNTGPA